MTYNVFGGILNLAQSINEPNQRLDICSHCYLLTFWCSTCTYHSTMYR